MFNQRFNDASYMAENHLNRNNDTDFPNKQYRPNISNKSAPSPKKSYIRIMGRDYPLTLTTYKRLVIGICVGRDSCRVEIAIIDNKLNEVRFTMSTWKLLLQQESEILQRFRNDTTSSYQEPISIDHLRIDFTRINDQRMAKISDGNSTIYMTEATIHQMFKYDRCIDHMFSWLSEILYSVTNKYTSFVNIIRNATVPTADYEKLITESEYFEPHSLIDCELLALSFNSMIRDPHHVPQ